MNIIAFDISLSCTGWASDYDGMQTIGRLEPPKLDNHGIPRLRWIRHKVIDSASPADLVVIEGYSFNSKDSHAHELGEVGGVVRIALSDQNLSFVEVPPASLKLFATGRGNAKKDEVLADAIRKLGYAGHSKDEADALWLLEMARCHYADAAKNDNQRRALAKIKWPRINDRRMAHA